MRVRESFLRRASKRDILVRTLGNLKGIYVNAGDHARALGVVERLLILRPDADEEQRARGVLLARLGHREEAIEQLRRWLATAPAGDQADRALQLLERLLLGGGPLEADEP